MVTEPMHLTNTSVGASGDFYCVFQCPEARAVLGPVAGRSLGPLQLIPFALAIYP
jgi:hypothetical protein